MGLVIEMETVKLKNGTEEVEVLVQTTMIALENVVNTNPIAAYELVELCKDASHKPFGNAGDILEDLSLVNNGQVHTSIKNIVLSAFEGEGFDLHLTFPVVK